MYSTVLIAPNFAAIYNARKDPNYMETQPHTENLYQTAWFPVDYIMGQLIYTGNEAGENGECLRVSVRIQPETIEAVREVVQYGGFYLGSISNTTLTPADSSLPLDTRVYDGHIVRDATKSLVDLGCIFEADELCPE